MSKEHNYGSGIGASSILIVIVILSLISFAALSLASANADYKLSMELSDRTKAYYKASSEAYALLADAVENNNVDKSEIITIERPITDNQNLQVIANLEVDSNTNYSIIKHQIVNISIPEQDDSLSLLFK